jgi:hypothetical protein
MRAPICDYRAVSSGLHLLPGGDAGFLAEQQTQANIFAKFGLIPRTIDVTDTVDPTHFSVAA